MTGLALGAAASQDAKRGAQGSPGDGDRLPSLTGLRFGAAFLVFGFHLQVAHIFGGGSTADRVLGWTFGHGAVGVSFFFVLSGFVLTWSARPKEPARDVWRRRAARIFPNHLVTAVVAIGGGVYVGSGVTIGAVVANLFLVQSWSPSQGVYFGLNTVSWSLSCELFFYLCFPLLIRVLARMSDRTLWPAAIGLMAVVWCVPLVTLPWSQPVAYWFIYVFPAARMAEFCLGMVLARIVRTGQWIGFPIWAAAGLLLAAYVLVGYVPVRFGYVALTVVPLALLIPAFAVADAAGRRTFWARRRAVWLGEISFAFYLVHQLVIRYASKLLHVPAQPPGWGFAHSAVVAVVVGAGGLIGAWVLHQYVEKPMVKRLSRRRPSPSASGANAVAVSAVPAQTAAGATDEPVTQA